MKKSAQNREKTYQNVEILHKLCPFLQRKTLLTQPMSFWMNLSMWNYPKTWSLLSGDWKSVSEYYRKIIVYFLWHRFFSNIKTKATNFATHRSVIALLHTLWHVISWLKSFSFVIQSDAAAKNSGCVIAKPHLILLLKRKSCLVCLTNVYKKNHSPIPYLQRKKLIQRYHSIKKRDSRQNGKLLCFILESDISELH